MNCDDRVRANDRAQREFHFDGNIVYRLIRPTSRPGEWIARDDQVGIMVSVNERFFELVK